MLKILFFTTSFLFSIHVFAQFNADQYIVEALNQFPKENFDKAVEILNQGIRQNPKESRLYMYRGLAYFGKLKANAKERKFYTLSIADLNTAIQISQKIADAYNERGKFFLFNEKYDS